MVSFVVAVMVTCFHSSDVLQRWITGAGWVVVAVLVINVIVTSVLEKEFGPNTDEAVNQGPLGTEGIDGRKPYWAVDFKDDKNAN